MLRGEGSLDIGISDLSSGTTEASAKDLGDLTSPSSLVVGRGGVEGGGDVEEERSPGGVGSGGLFKDDDTLDGGGEGLEEVALGPGAVEVDLDKTDILGVMGLDGVVEGGRADGQRDKDCLCVCGAYCYKKKERRIKGEILVFKVHGTDQSESISDQSE